MLTRQLRVYQWIRPGRSISSDRLEEHCLPHLARAIAVYRRMTGADRRRVHYAAEDALTGFRPDRVKAIVRLLDDVAVYEWPPAAQQAALRLQVFEAASREREYPVLDPTRATELLSAVLAKAAHPGAVARDAGMPDVGVLDAEVPGAVPRDAGVAAAGVLDEGVPDAVQPGAVVPGTVPPGGAAPNAMAPNAAVPDVSRHPGDAVPLLYADYPEFHRLVAFPPEYSPDDLRADYDLAQAQALLYDATQVTVYARADLGHIVRYARLSRLLYRITRLRSGGYRLVFDGPNSVLRHTHAYGVDFARFLAALVQAGDWKMTAEIVLRKGWRPVVFSLSDADGLRSRVPAPALFDSGLEETFARKFGSERKGWRLQREGAVLEAGEALIVPDFVFTHKDGTEVALEIVGYWTPEYIREKFTKLAALRRAPNMVVAVRKAMAVQAAQAGNLPGTVLPFRSGILLRDLMPRLEAFRKPETRAVAAGVRSKRRGRRKVPGRE